jgi:hypothetical protein
MVAVERGNEAQDHWHIVVVRRARVSSVALLHATRRLHKLRGQSTA